MTNILYIHQSAELYGSDKTLLYLVMEIKQCGFNPIVVLPSKGPLYNALQSNQIEIIIAPVLKISRKMFSFSNLVTLPYQTFQSFTIIKKRLYGRKIHMVHSNTLAVLTGALYAKRYGIKHLWHVHEIIAHPKLISDLYPRIVNYFSDIVVFNSVATRDFMVKKKPEMLVKSQVIHNGLDRQKPLSSTSEVFNFRKIFFNAGENDIVLALVGRISRWKGQQLLLNVFRILEKDNSDIKLTFVGSAPTNQEIFLESLQQKIIEYKLQEKVTIVPFQNDVWKIWDSIDIAVVPSTEPEPFGLVALEAMLASKPVVGANHGGLTEIIVEGETGFLVEPNSEDDLKAALLRLILDKKLRTDFGFEANKRAQLQFSLKKYVDDFLKLYQ